MISTVFIGSLLFTAEGKVATREIKNKMYRYVFHRLNCLAQITRFFKAAVPLFDTVKVFRNYRFFFWRISSGESLHCRSIKVKSWVSVSVSCSEWRNFWFHLFPKFLGVIRGVAQLPKPISLPPFLWKPWWPTPKLRTHCTYYLESTGDWQSRSQVLAWSGWFLWSFL